MTFSCLAKELSTSHCVSPRCPGTCVPHSDQSKDGCCFTTSSHSTKIKPNRRCHLVLPVPTQPTSRNVFLPKMLKSAHVKHMKLLVWKTLKIFFSLCCSAFLQPGSVLFSYFCWETGKYASISDLSQMSAAVWRCEQGFIATFTSFLSHTSLTGSRSVKKAPCAETRTGWTRDPVCLRAPLWGRLTGTRRSEKDQYTPTCSAGCMYKNTFISCQCCFTLL